MLERPGRTQIRSENFTAKRPGISGRQPTLCSRAANQHPPGILQRLPSELRKVIKDSTVWGRIQSQVMFAFTSKYALALYELLQKRVNLSHVWEQEFALDDFRKLMGVPDSKLMRGNDLMAYCVRPAVLKVNALADNGVALEPLRRGKAIY